MEGKCNGACVFCFGDICFCYNRPLNAWTKSARNYYTLIDIANFFISYE